MKTFAFLLLLASPTFAATQPNADGTPEDVEISTVAQTPSPPPGSLDSAKIRLDSQDAAGALRDAETALQHGGGADAYAARADAKRALGRPVDEAIADYGEAAKLDPRYIEKWKGLIAQKKSEAHPNLKGTGDTGLNGVPIGEIAIAALSGALLLGAGGVLLSKRREHAVAPDDDDEVKPTGKEPPKA